MLKASRECEISNPTTYFFSFKKEGWASFTINESTGEFCVNSDWGNFSHCWYMPAIAGGNLTHFIANTGSNYLANKLKLGSESKALDDVIDEEATREWLRDCVRENYPEDSLDYEELMGDIEDISDFRNEYEIGENYPIIADFFIQNCEGPVREKSYTYKKLKDELLPFFCEWLRANVLPKE